MKRQKVKSSRIDSVGYDDKAQVLEVAFINGAVYQYKGVPKNIAESLRSAESPGRYFGANIQKAYDNEKVPALTGEDPCPGCEHLLSRHYFDVTGVARCLHTERGTSSSGIIGLPWEASCDCAGGISNMAEARERRRAEEDGKLQERVNRIVGREPWVQEAERVLSSKADESRDFTEEEARRGPCDE
jgi:hypothetical protein